MTIDPYKVLGVRRNASTANIHSAYRNKSKAVHPDMPGGNKEVFEELKIAHDCLIDSDRRAKYDATGDITGKEPDRTMEGAISTIANVFEQVMGEIGQRGIDPTQVDLALAINRGLDLRLKTIKEDRLKVAQTLKVLGKLLGRFKAKKGKQSYLDHFIKAKMEILNMNTKMLDLSEVDLKNAKDLFSGTTFDVEQMQMRSTYLTQTGWTG